MPKLETTKHRAVVYERDPKTEEVKGVKIVTLPRARKLCSNLRIRVVKNRFHHIGGPRCAYAISGKYGTTKIFTHQFGDVVRYENSEIMTIFDPSDMNQVEEIIRRLLKKQWVR